MSRFRTHWWEYVRKDGGSFFIEVAVYSNHSSMIRGIRNHSKFYPSKNNDLSNMGAMCRRWVASAKGCGKDSSCPVSRLFFYGDPSLRHVIHEAIHAAVWVEMFFSGNLTKMGTPRRLVRLEGKGGMDEENIAEFGELIADDIWSWVSAGYPDEGLKNERDGDK